MEISYSTKKDLSEETVQDLKDRIKALNEGRGVDQDDTAYVSISGKKDELVEKIIEDEKINVKVDGGAAQTSQEVMEVSLDQLRVHPDNERHDIDYHDPQLMSSLNQTNGQFMSVPRVVDSGKTLSDGRTIYYVLAGNRSTTVFKRWNEDRGIDLSDVTLDVMVRTYEGTEKQKRAQELMEISLDNDTHKVQSPIEKARAFKRLQDEAGMTQGAIAKREGIHGSQVSSMMKLLYLPKKVQSLVHYGYDSARYARWKPKDLEQFGVPFHVKDDGEVVIEGISLANAEVMLGQFPRKRSLDFDQACLDLEDFLSRDDVTRYAKKLNAKQFERSLVDKLSVVAEEQSWTWYEVNGGVEGPTLDEDSQATDGPATEVKGGVDKGSKEPAGKPAGKPTGKTVGELAKRTDTSETRLTVGKLDDRTSAEAAQDLRNEVVTLAPDWRETLTEAIEMEEVGALNAFKSLFYHEVLVYSDTIED